MIATTKGWLNGSGRCANCKSVLPEIERPDCERSSRQPTSWLFRVGCQCICNEKAGRQACRPTRRRPNAFAIGRQAGRPTRRRYEVGEQPDQKMLIRLKKLFGRPSPRAMSILQGVMMMVIILTILPEWSSVFDSE